MKSKKILTFNALFVHSMLSTTMASLTTENTVSLLETLAAQLRGDLLIRGDAAAKEKFDAQRFRTWNKDLSIRAEPIAFAMVSGVKDVVTTVKFCAQHDIPVTVRGKGAHSPWGMAQVRYIYAKLTPPVKDIYLCHEIFPARTFSYLIHSASFDLLP